MSDLRRVFLSAALAAAVCGSAEAAGAPKHMAWKHAASKHAVSEQAVSQHPVSAHPVSVPMDNVTLVSFKTPVSTVYIGNPSVAQLNVIDSRHVFVLGKRFGATNLLALGPDKTLIENDPVTVTSRHAEAVTIFRGNETYNYVCTEFHCETRPVPGDPRDWFDNTEGAAGQHEETANRAAAIGAAPGQMH
jgi:hypothetical protein